MESKLTKNQVQKFKKVYTEDGQVYKIIANVRFDDKCGNGHNTFAVTGEIYRKKVEYWEDDSFGMIHDEIAKHFPILKDYLKWHLVSTDGPLHYNENALYWAGKHHNEPNWDNFKGTVVFGSVKDDLYTFRKDMSKTELTQWLNNRLPELMEAFQKDMITLGFNW